MKSLIDDRVLALTQLNTRGTLGDTSAPLITGTLAQPQLSPSAAAWPVLEGEEGGEEG